VSGFLKCVDSLGYLLKKSRPNRYYATLVGCGAGQRRQGFPIDQGVSGCSRSDSDQGRPARRGLAATGVAGGRVGPRRAQRVYISLGKRGDKILGLSYRGGWLGANRAGHLGAIRALRAYGKRKCLLFRTKGGIS